MANSALCRLGACAWCVMAEFLGIKMLCDECGLDLSWVITLLAVCPAAGCEIRAVALKCMRCGNGLALHLRWSNDEFVVRGMGFREGKL